jgi:hypothetical protein
MQNEQMDYEQHNQRTLSDIARSATNPETGEIDENKALLGIANAPGITADDRIKYSGNLIKQRNDKQIDRILRDTRMTIPQQLQAINKIDPAKARGLSESLPKSITPLLDAKKTVFESYATDMESNRNPDGTLNEMDYLRMKAAVQRIDNGQGFLQSNTPEAVQQFIDANKKQVKATGRAQRWEAMGAEWEDIQKLPKGSKEREDAITAYEMKWAPSAGLDMTPEGQNANALNAFLKGKASEKGKQAGQADPLGGANPIVVKSEDDLRKDFESTKEVASLRDLYTAKNSANDVWAKYKKGEAKPYEVDQSLGFFASKGLDPNSIVMPGEFDRFGKGLGYESGVAFLQSFAKGGLRLTDTQREGMLNIINRSYSAAKTKGKNQYDNYNRIAKERNLNTKNVTGGVDYLFNDGGSKGTTGAVNTGDAEFDALWNGIKK